MMSFCFSPQRFFVLLFVCFVLLFQFIYLFCFWLRWVFAAARRLPPVASRGYSSLQCAGFSLRLLLLLRNAGSRAQAQQLWHLDLVAPQHVGSSWTTARTRVRCIGRQILLFFFKGIPLFLLFLLFYYLFLAVLGLHFCARAFSSCGKRGPLFIVVRGPLTLAASLVVEHSLQMRRLSRCGSRAQLLRGTWDLPRPGLEPVSPALAGRFSTTASPGKSQFCFFLKLIIVLFSDPTQADLIFSVFVISSTLNSLSVVQVSSQLLLMPQKLYVFTFLKKSPWSLQTCWNLTCYPLWCTAVILGCPFTIIWGFHLLLPCAVFLFPGSCVLFFLVSPQTHTPFLVQPKSTASSNSLRKTVWEVENFQLPISENGFILSAPLMIVWLGIEFYVGNHFPSKF